MTIRRLTPPSEYLHSASNASLQSFELARLNHAANLRREIATLIDQWITESSEALLARWMIEQNNSFHPAVPPPIDILRQLRDPDSEPLPLFPAPSDMISPAPPRFADVLRPVDASKKQKFGS